MKKIIFFALAAVMLANYSCVEDRGNYDYAEPGAFYVDTAGLTADMTRRLAQFEELDIAPKLVFDGDESQLQHTWTIYRNASEQEAEPVDEQYNGSPSLALPMAYDAADYYVQYVAHDPVSDRSAEMRWRVILSAADAVGSGWLVFHQKDGLGDCDLIKTSLLDATVAEDEIARNVYSKANPTRPITTGPLVSGMYYVYNSSYTGFEGWVTLLWEGGGGRLVPETMKLAADDLGAFTLEGGTIDNPTYYTTTYDPIVLMEAMINDGQLYFGDGIFNGPVPMLDGSSYRTSHILISTFARNRIVYDDENMRFIYNNLYSGTLTTLNTSNEPYFDFEDVGKVMINMTQGYGPNGAAICYCVMRDPADNGKRYIYIWNMSNQTSAGFTQSGVLDISNAPTITGAELFAYGSRGPVMFYAGGSKIGQIKYDPTGIPWSYTGSAEVWTAPAGEVITSMKFMKYAGVGLPEQAADKHLFVATWNEATSEGKVHVLKADVTNGALDDEPVATYTGFGKVKDMCYKGV